MFKTKPFQVLLWRRFSVKINDIAIASAVRTPVHAGLRKLPKEQLWALVLEEAIKRGAIPKDDVQTVCVASPAGGEGLATRSADILKGAACTVAQDEVLALQLAIEALQMGQTHAAVVGGLQANCGKFLANARDRFARALAEGLLDAELLAVSVRRKGAPLVTISQDDCAPKQSEDMHSATALVLTNSQTAKRLALQPLARITGCHLDADAATAVRSLLGNAHLRSDQIDMWELQYGNTFNAGQQSELDVAKCNIHGVETTLSSPLQLMTHLTHALPMGQRGCISVAGGAFLLEKLSNTAKGHIPLLTLYTKEDCSLCDALVEELEAEFPGQYQLDKVSITAKENLRFLRLFRHDIPVLFLNRQFLCMHRLNVKLLRRKLKELSLKSGSK